MSKQSARDTTIKQRMANGDLEQRITKALKENRLIDETVSRQLNLAINGTAPLYNLKLLDSNGKQIGANKAYRELCIYRIIYSSPDIKLEIEQHLGQSIGNVPPPYSPLLLRHMFDKNGIKLASLARRSRLRWVSWTFVVVFCLTLLTIANREKSMYTAIVMSVISYVYLVFAYMFITKRVCVPQIDEQATSCCVCGLRTQDLLDNSDSAGRLLCTNCEGTAVCKVGCGTCCPYLIPFKDIERNIKIQESMKNHPDLCQRFKTKMENAVLKSVNSGEIPTIESKNEMVTNILHDNPDLKREIESAVAQHEGTVHHAGASFLDVASIDKGGAESNGLSQGVGVFPEGKATGRHPYNKALEGGDTLVGFVSLVSARDTLAERNNDNDSIATNGEDQAGIV